VPRPDAEEEGGRVSWRHVALGVIAGEVILLVLSNGGVALTNGLFGAAGRVDGGVVGMATLLAVLAGGFLAGRTAGRFGIYQGVWVAVGFILVGAVFTFLQEAQLVQTSLHSGSRTLIDLGPMSMGNLISGDLLALFGGSVGGSLGAPRVRQGR
jgi:hypothetical protein